MVDLTLECLPASLWPWQWDMNQIAVCFFHVDLRHPPFHIETLLLNSYYRFTDLPINNFTYQNDY